MIPLSYGGHLIKTENLFLFAVYFQLAISKTFWMVELSIITVLKRLDFNLSNFYWCGTVDGAVAYDARTPSSNPIHSSCLWNSTFSRWWLLRLTKFLYKSIAKSAKMDFKNTSKRANSGSLLLLVHKRQNVVSSVVMAYSRASVRNCRL